METTRDISAEELAALRDPGARHGAFDRLVGAYLRPLYWHARRLVVVHEDAEDVVQAVAQARGDVTPQQVAEIARENAARLFSIPC